MRYIFNKALIPTGIAASLFVASFVALIAPVIAQETEHCPAIGDTVETVTAFDPENMQETLTASGLDNAEIPAEPDSAFAGAPMIAYIPESSWRTPEMEGRELTEDLALEHPRGNFVDRTIDNGSWGVGEHLVFSVDYGFINAGTATMSVLGTVDVNGGTCYHIRTTARSNRFVSSFYEVNDRVDSYIDSSGLFSRRFEKHLREGKYESDRIVDFYHDRLLALNTQKKHAVAEIPLYVQDILSVLYYIRTFQLEAKNNTVIDVYADGTVYPLELIVHKREKIKVPAGTFNTLLVEPKLKSEGLFRQKGKLLVWLTDDDRKMPVKMTSEIVIGSIGSNLVSYQHSE